MLHGRASPLFYSSILPDFPHFLQSISSHTRVDPEPVPSPARIRLGILMQKPIAQRNLHSHGFNSPAVLSHGPTH